MSINHTSVNQPLNNTPLLSYPPELTKQLVEMTEIRAPCFVYGTVGRTTLIRSSFPHVKIYDSREILEVKNTGGFYAIKDGVLTYTQGVLAQAMVKGEKLCFRNIDSNPALLQYLRPVIRSRLMMDSLGNKIAAHEDFRIFFTCNAPVDVRNVACIGPVEFSLETALGLFDGIAAAAAEQTASDQNKLQHRKSQKIDFRELVVSCLCFIHENSPGTCNSKVACTRPFADCQATCLKGVPACDCLVDSTKMLCSRHFRALCDISAVLRLDYATGNDQRLGLYQCLVNVFLRHESRLLAEHLLVSPAPAVLPDMNFAKTAPVESVLKGLILNIATRKPTLLVGETGAGKTALVQYLCSHAEFFFGHSVSLRVVNMSTEFDSNDLIGGYRSLDVDAIVRDLCTRAGISVRSACRQQLLGQLAACGNAAVAAAASRCLAMLRKGVPFVYKQGILTQAMQEGSWILLDEINLCSEETLGLIEAVLSKDQLILFDSGDFTPIRVHPNFMIFACMNPHGDFGKKRYDSLVFNRLDFLDFSGSIKCVKAVVLSITRNLLAEVDAIAGFYFELKKMLAARKLTNIVEPLISGRTLCRALRYVMSQVEMGVGSLSAIYNAVNLLFFTQLDLSSRARAVQLLAAALPIKSAGAISSAPQSLNGYIVTAKTAIHLSDVELAIQASLPVLIQGDTSTGKTSLIYALAHKHGKKVIRINNHNQTEASDYIGSYTSNGEEVFFRQGPLVTALKAGHWVILDELNLAPSDVLESLNRLLDDNRELYIPEIDERVVPHAGFRLFATQNHASYGGRHGLAKSFRNRFVEIFFYEKDEAEISEILEKACKLPLSFIKRMMLVYAGLKRERSINSLITLRDLFKWAKRMPGDYYELYSNGMGLIYERQRTEEDRKTVLGVFNSAFIDRVQFERRDFNQLLGTEHMGPDSAYNEPGFVMTRSYRRLIGLIYKAWMSCEPVLLIGETGIGKTKVCEIVCSLCGINLRSINLHSSIESSDFVGHPYMEKGAVRWMDGPLVKAMTRGEGLLIDEINLAEDSVLERLNSVLEEKRSLFIPETEKEIHAHSSFQVIATMNPSGDFGKRELSPALRNRFTEIYFELGEGEYEEIFDEMVSRVCRGREDKSSTTDDTTDIEYYRQRFRELKGMNVRKIGLICEHILRMSRGVGNEVISIDAMSSASEIWADCLDMLGMSHTNCEQVSPAGQRAIRCGPFTLSNSLNASGTTGFSFASPVSQANLRRILRGLATNKGILLEGDPGVGKTSIVQSLATSIAVPIIRINLSEQTEMSDLLGSYVPVGDSIRFVQSQLVEFLKEGRWIILDEINLCGQSVIEGLNSILDHRQSIEVNGERVEVHEKSRIFGTMNPWSMENGRKRLPKSFIDRFIVVRMENYREDDIREILRGKYGEGYLFDRTRSLRGNIKLNLIGDEITDPEYKIDLIDNGMSLKFNSLCLQAPKACLDYVIPHSQVSQISLLFSCLYRGVPVILLGALGRRRLLSFAASVLGLGAVEIDCSKETDVFDLLGQYQKADDMDGTATDSLFAWRDSLLVSSLGSGFLVIFNSPEAVDKSVFDRLNALFEGEPSLNVYEKVSDTVVPVHPRARFVLACDTVHGLSPALIDRCHVIRLAQEYSYLDIYKIFSLYSDQRSLFTGITNDTLPAMDGLPAAIDAPLDTDIKRLLAYNHLPSYLNRHLGVGNSILDSEISSFFTPQLETPQPYDRDLLARYRQTSAWAVKLPTTYAEVGALALKGLTVPGLVKAAAFLTGRLGGSKTCCKDVPGTLAELKCLFIEGLPQQRLCDLGDLIECTRLLANASEDSTVEGGPIADDLGFDQDPLKLIRADLINEKITRSNSIKAKIAQTAISIYKYGIGQLSPLFTELNDLNREYLSAISAIDNALKRDYGKFRSIVGSVTFCDYLNDLELRLFLEDFSDVADLGLARLFHERNHCQKCYSLRNQAGTSRLASLMLINGDRSVVVHKPEYARCLYDVLMGKKPNWTGLVLEAIAFSEPVDIPESIKLNLAFSDQQINECLSSIFPEKTEAKIINVKSSRISLGQDVVGLLSGIPRDLPVCLLSVFSTPEQAINELQATKLAWPSSDDPGLLTAFRAVSALEAFLTGLYKTDRCLSMDRNYLHFLELYCSKVECGSQESVPPGTITEPRHNYTPALLERFFLDSRAFEFLDKLFFSHAILSLSFSPLLYAYTLLYRSFEIENAWKTKHRQAALKLKKEPRLYEQTIHEFLDRFLYAPVLKLAKITFEFPGCCCDRSADKLKLASSDNGNHIPEQLSGILGLVHEETCECHAWKALASTQRTVILSLLQRPLSLGDVMDRFVGRTQFSCSGLALFSESELALAKLLNSTILNLNSEKYDKETAYAVLNLCLLGVEYPFPPYLYFAYKFSNAFEEEVECGTGLHDGHGQEHMTEDVKEDEVNDDGGEQDEVDSEGMEMSNEGGLYSVEGEEADTEEAAGEDVCESEAEGSNEDSIDSGSEGEDSEVGIDNEGEGDDGKSDSEDSEGDSDIDDDIDTTITDATDSNAIDDTDTTDSNATDNNEGNTTEEPGDYRWKEEAINKAQTCDSADGYAAKVSLGGLGTDALQEGSGTELALGEGEEGPGLPAQAKSARFTCPVHDCARLSSLLRSVLEANRTSKYKGDFKSGKKLNLKRIIPYIASGYRRDKIWMKRMKNDQREYILRLFVDNSKSMNDQGLVDVLAGVYVKLTNSFALLGIPVELYKFGSALVRCDVGDLSFDEEKTVVDWTDQFEDGINVILTDGVIQSGCYSTGNFIAVIIDRGDVKTMSRVSILENRVFIEKYLDTFGMKYCIVSGIEDLERVFIDTLSEIVRTD